MVGEEQDAGGAAEHIRPVYGEYMNPRIKFDWKKKRRIKKERMGLNYLKERVKRTEESLDLLFGKPKINLTV